MVVCAEVIHEVVDLCIGGMHLDMGGEDPTQRMPIMIGGALAVDSSRGRIEEGEEIRCAISPIVKVLKSRLTSRCGQGGRDTVEGLNARAFIETVYILWRVGITSDDMVHFGKEIRIGDLQVVFAPMGPKGMFQENPMDGGMADRLVDELGMFFEIALCITQ